MRWGILFAGVDGVGWGLEAAGHTPVWAVEMDPLAAEYHRRNHPHVRLIKSDVQAVDVAELPNVECLWASPPCQGSSQARRKDLAPREDVWVGRDILRYVAELAPRVVIVENVPPYRKHPVYREIVAGLVDLGYTVEARILNAADYGVPQTRERLIIQARNDGRIGWPSQPPRRMGWYEALADILPPPDRPLAPWQAKRWQAAYASLNSRYIPVLLDGQFKYGDDVLNVVTGEQPAPCVMASDHSRKDIVYPVMVDNQWRYGDDGMRLFHAGEPTSTVMASDGSAKYIIYPAPIPLRARLTARCSARLQTLPDTAIWPDTFTDAIKLIGNAVPSLLAQRLAEALEQPSVWNVSLWEGAVA